MKISYNWLKEFFPKSLHRLGKPEELAKKLINFGLEVSNVEFLENDVSLEIEITANRGDCLSHSGIAREIAAIYNLPLKIPPLHFVKLKEPIKNLPFKIKIEKGPGKKSFCYRYFAQVIQGVKITQSPSWLAERLSWCGIRPINMVVDITNYVLLELGQPLHAFDYELIKNKEIVVRWAKKGEKIVTLDEKERILEENIPVIADSEKAIALAGIIGGENTAVNENTKNILLESAYFDAVAIRQAAKKLGLTTESSYRFERGVDWQNVHYAARRAASLLEQFASGKLQNQNIDLKPFLYKPRKIMVEFREINDLLGTELKPKQIVSFLKRLKLDGEEKKKGIAVEIPSYRNDLTKPVDLIEEVARIYSYENIPSTISSFCPVIDSKLIDLLQSKENQVEKEIRQFLLSAGLSEVINYSFLSLDTLKEFDHSPEGKVISLRNPVSQETAYLRTTLLPGLLHNAIFNFRYQIENIKIFEIGKVYFREDNNLKEKKYLAGLLTGEERNTHWKRKPEKFSIYHLRGLVDGLLSKIGIKNYTYQETNVPYFTPGKGFEIIINHEEKIVIGEIGELGPALTEKYEFRNNLYFFEMKLESLFNLANLEKIYTSLPKYPFIQRDLSFVIQDNVSHANVLKLILKNGGEYLQQCELIDLYKNENIHQGFHSVTYRLTYRSPQGTLTSEEVEKSEEKVTRALEEQFHAQIRRNP